MPCIFHHNSSMETQQSDVGGTHYLRTFSTDLCENLTGHWSHRSWLDPWVSYDPGHCIARHPVSTILACGFFISVLRDRFCGFSHPLSVKTLSGSDLHSSLVKSIIHNEKGKKRYISRIIQKPHGLICTKFAQESRRR